MTNPALRKHTSPKLLATIFLVLGLPFVGIGIWFGWSSWSLLSVAQRTEGTVIRMVESPTNLRSDGLAPVVAFQIAGERHEFQSRFYYYPPQYSVGDTVTVLHDPHHPKSTGIESFMGLWLFPLIFGGLGGVTATVGVVILVHSRFRRMSNSESTVRNDNVSHSDANSVNFLEERADL